MLSLSPTVNKHLHQTPKSCAHPKFYVGVCWLLPWFAALVVGLLVCCFLVVFPFLPFSFFSFVLILRKGREKKRRGGEVGRGLINELFVTSVSRTRL